MAVFDMLPSAQGSYNNWTLGAGSTKTNAVRPPDDDDTSYVTTTDENSLDSYTVNDKPGGLVSVNGVNAIVRAKRDNADPAAGGCNMFSAFGASVGGSTGFTTTTSYTTFTTTSIGRPGGGSWTVADIADSTLGIAFYRNEGNPSGTGNTIRVTTAYLQVDAVVAAGGFAFLLASLIPGLLGAHILLQEIPEIAREVSKRKTHIQAHEYLQTWRDLRDAKHTVYFC